MRNKGIGIFKIGDFKSIVFFVRIIPPPTCRSKIFSSIYAIVIGINGKCGKNKFREKIELFRVGIT
jgi:hypothetical protein